MSFQISNQHPLIINRKNATIQLWDVEKQMHETHTFEFIEELYKMVVTQQKSSEYVTIIK